MEDKELVKMILNKIIVLPEEKRLPQAVIGNVLRRVKVMDRNNSPTNCSRNYRAISSNIQLEIDLTRIKQKEFNREISEELEKLNTKVSEIHVNNMTAISQTNNSVIFTPRKAKLPSLAHKKSKSEIKRNIKFAKRSKTALKKQIVVVDTLLEKCMNFSQDLKNFKYISDQFNKSHRHLKEYFLNSDAYQKKKIQHKYSLLLSSEDKGKTRYGIKNFRTIKEYHT
ncbi:hypothetical protein SteCoe_34213 [Stentor coeruleus]|uniref:Uncharacterized protein n=1 Tax=Stentor coeruleus TaxID=5963 RepID=A0A1R2AV03_9CILI|nr:hypothetical protein SteCoe_34213 [Stentor coeruleus]